MTKQHPFQTKLWYVLRLLLALAACACALLGYFYPLLVLSVVALLLGGYEVVVAAVLFDMLFTGASTGSVWYASGIVLVLSGLAVVARPYMICASLGRRAALRFDI